MSTKYQALVIGGGPAGATAALLLAKAGWRVILVERSEFPRQKVCGEFLSATNLPLLDHLGIGDVFRTLAGPEVHEVALYLGTATIRAAMPSVRDARGKWGRALSREILDTILLNQAQNAGVEVRQPWSVVHFSQDHDGYLCEVQNRRTLERHHIRATVIVAAHGSWMPGGLPTQQYPATRRGSDLFGFKAHFRDSSLPCHLMPMLVFPGGYGGMVHCDRGRVSLSCCIRRDKLQEVRQQFSTASAGAAVLTHIKRSCLGVREALSDTGPVDIWHSAGPLRPGIRLRPTSGVFLVGNAAGEAHPIIAEGISMALQSSLLLCERLIKRQESLLHPDFGKRQVEALEVAREYTARWHRHFVPRIRAAAAFAHSAMNPGIAYAARLLIGWVPSLLSVGARMSGKAHCIAATLRGG